MAKEVEKIRAKKRQATSTGGDNAKPIKSAENTANSPHVVNLPHAGETGKSRDIVADKLGTSGCKTTTHTHHRF